MAREARYPVRQAAADLRDAGLLAGVLVAREGVLAPLGSGSLNDKAGGFLGAALDSRDLPAGRLFVALRGEHVDGRAYAAATVAAGHWALTRSWDGDGADPLLATTAPAGSGVLLVRDAEAALARLAACWRARLDPVVIGVTGSNGKTTTKDFLAAALGGAGPVCATTGNHNNRLGVPLTLLSLRPRHRFAVVEMGASAEGDIAALAGLVRPHIGVITNAARAHLAEFGTLEGVIAGKGELLDALPAEGTAVLNADSPGYPDWRKRARCRVVVYGRAAGEHHWRWRDEGAGAGPELWLDGERWSVPLPGEHNGANLAAALLAARAAGVGDAAMARGLEDFRGSAHRSVVEQIGGRTVLDDSYNANPASMVAAARSLAALTGGRKIGVLGHMAELGAESVSIHHTTGRDLVAAGLDVLIAVGEQARPLGEGFDAAGGTGHYCATLEEAAARAAALTSAGDVLLVKGSRSAGMERLLPLLATAFAAD